MILVLLIELFLIRTTHLLLAAEERNKRSKHVLMKLKLSLKQQSRTLIARSFRRDWQSSPVALLSSKWVLPLKWNRKKSSTAWKTHSLQPAQQPRKESCQAEELPTSAHSPPLRSSARAIKMLTKRLESKLSCTHW